MRTLLTFAVGFLVASEAHAQADTAGRDELRRVVSAFVEKQVARCVPPLKDNVITFAFSLHQPKAGVGKDMVFASQNPPPREIGLCISRALGALSLPPSPTEDRALLVVVTAGVLGTSMTNLEIVENSPPGGTTSTATEVHGSLDKEVIRDVIRKHSDEVRFCYERRLIDNHELAGRVMVQFTIAASGHVVASHVQNTTLNDEPTETCIANTTLRWAFPKPTGGGVVVVSYPFVFKWEPKP